jgi:hypothetical protein
MTFYVNLSWACALFRNNKQHVNLGQKRKCQRVEEIFQMEPMQDICRGSVGPLERTQEVLRLQTRAEVAKILFDR